MESLPQISPVWDQGTPWKKQEERCDGEQQEKRDLQINKSKVSMNSQRLKWNAQGLHWSAPNPLCICYGFPLSDFIRFHSAGTGMSLGLVPFLGLFSFYCPVLPNFDIYFCFISLFLNLIYIMLGRFRTTALGYRLTATCCFCKIGEGRISLLQESDTGYFNHPRAGLMFMRRWPI